MSYKTHSTWRPSAPDPALAWAAVNAQRNACAQGRHDVATVPEGRAVYAPGGIRRPVGERYCRCCLVTLRASGDPQDTSHDASRRLRVWPDPGLQHLDDQDHDQDDDQQHDEAHVQEIPEVRATRRPATRAA